MHKHFNINTLGRDFVVGDIHGCYDEFQDKLQEIKFDPNTDRMFSVGDLVDRGPKNVEAARLLNHDWFHAVKGNHEVMYLDYRAGINSSMYMHNGGLWVLKYSHDILNEISNLFRHLPISMEIETKNGNIGITHAQSFEDWNHVKDAVDINPLIWDREVVSYSETYKDWNVKNIYMTYHGHTPLKNVKQIGNSRYIDTGAFLNTKDWLQYDEPGFLTVEQIN
jgi:serine/threonine protein phosphatase 1